MATFFRLFLISFRYGTMLDIRLCGCGCVPVRGPLCLFWRETHTKGLCVRLPTKPEEDEGRKVPQTTEVSRTNQSTEKGSQQERAGDC